MLLNVVLYSIENTRLIDMRCSVTINGVSTIFDDFFIGVQYPQHELLSSALDQKISFAYKDDIITTTYSNYCKSIVDYNELRLGMTFIGLYLTTSAMVNKTSKFKCVKAPDIIDK